MDLGPAAGKLSEASERKGLGFAGSHPRSGGITTAEENDSPDLLTRGKIKFHDTTNQVITTTTKSKNNQWPSPRTDSTSMGGEGAKE